MAAAIAPAVATPVPLAPCQVGAIRLTHDMSLSSFAAAITRVFPAATVATAVTRSRVRTTVRDGADVLMTVESGGRTLASARVVSVDLRSARFQLAPGLYPGVPLARAARVLAPITIDKDPEGGAEMVASPRLDAMLKGWEQVHCGLMLVPGPGTVELYTAKDEGMSALRFKPGARVASFSVLLP
jgi:hypothetical protein